MAEANVKRLFIREYQLELLEAAKEKNIIVCLGTGTGKTFISIKLIEHLARVDDTFQSFSDGAKRTFFLVNSVPLVFQQANAIADHSPLKVKSYCGEMGVDFWTKDDWLKEFEENQVLVMTHQIYLDLLQHAKLTLSRANLLVFDECHHADKNHPFKKIMDRFVDFPKKDHPRILGLTASVVGKKVKRAQIHDEIKRLERTLRSVCKTASDPNVVEKFGAKPKEIMVSYSSLNHMNPVAEYLESEFHSVLDPLKAFLEGDISGSEETVMKELTVVKGAVRECMSALADIGIWAAYEVSKMLIEDLEKRCKRVSSSLSPNTKLACLLLETTLTSLREICWKYDEFRIANVGNKDKIQQEYLKPKVKELLRLFKNVKRDGICAIVFVERRYAACVVSKLINALASERLSQYCHLKSDFVTGHGLELWGISDTEMKFNKQNEKLRVFRTGRKIGNTEPYNVLVGTSVVEEGVDIPKCNLVVMFDFPQNYRAFVQSRGRGRAKDAEYVLLVNQSELSKRREEQEQYQQVDEELTKLCQRDRAVPTDEECDDAVNEYPLNNYFTECGARLDMGSSIGLLYRYCSKLPCDRFTHLKPTFTRHVLNDKYQFTLKMPGNSCIPGIIEGEPMQSLKEAKQAVAYKMCRMLHEHGALNDLLLLNESSSESEGEDEVDAPSEHKTGTRKRLRPHFVKTSEQLYGVMDFSKMLYVYAIQMEFDDVLHPVKKRLWDRKNVSLGIVTKEKLPTIPSFSLYNDIGKLTVSLELCQTVHALTVEQRDLINWFHRFIFNETLSFQACSPTLNGCRIVLLNCEDKRRYSIRTGINFTQMMLLMETESTSDGRFSSRTDLLDSVVIQSYLRNPPHCIVTSITEYTPTSAFPDLGVAKTFQEYHESRYLSKISDPSQPLVEVVRHSRKIDCRSGKNYRDSKLRQEVLTCRWKSKVKQLYLIPETLEFRTSPLSLTLRALFLPAIIYRVDSLVSITELRGSISSYKLLILESLAEIPKSPSKRSKFSSESLLSDEDEASATLSRYFYPYDPSKSVPLLKLLEAVTCASSGDDFNLERLEMLGDSFLKMAVSIHVYWHKDHKDEGKLTKYRTRQISNKNLFKLAMKQGLPKYIKHSVLSKDTWVPPGFTRSKLPNGNLSSDYDSDVDDDDVIDGDVIVNSAVMSQLISDKSIADSMEALIGAHLIECGYMGALRFMTWLGVDVFFAKVIEEEQPTNGRRRKSPTPQCVSNYANYPLPTLEIPVDEDRQRYEQILAEQTREMSLFEKKIGYQFKNKVLLLEAFTHPTFNDNHITGSYQRLEFLGDAILDFLVTQHVYNNCESDLKPGELTDLRSALVNNNIFAVIAVENDFHKYLKEYSPSLFSTIGNFVKGVHEYQKNFDNKVNPDPYVIAVESDSSDMACIEAPKPLGDVFESVAGAIFLDSGLNIHEVWRICYPMLRKFIDEYSKNVPKNPVREVKELDPNAQFSSADIQTDGRVSCTLTFEGKKYEGIGRNKHNAKLSAAYKALKRSGNPI